MTKKYKMTTDIPENITTPDKVETRLGTLKFFDGLPDQSTVEKVYDNLYFMRGVEVFLNTLAATSSLASFRGLRSLGVDNHTAVLLENRLDAKSLFLTANTQTATLWGVLDLREGPVVVEIPPGVLGLADDAWMTYIVDMGVVGPDRGQGGKYLFLPPGYEGEVPEGYFVAKSLTYNVGIGIRGFTVKGNTGPAMAAFQKYYRSYPLAQAANPPETKIIMVSGRYFNTIQPVNYQFYEDINTVIQDEPAEAADPEILGLLASIGILKGKPFAPDERMKRILTDAVAVANATARAISFRSRDEDAFYLYGNESAWFNPWVGGSHEFIQNNVRLLNARTCFMYIAAGISPAMTVKMVGAGSQYAVAAVDADGQFLDGSRSYQLHLSSNIPAKTFWSLIPYDTQTRSVLQTDQREAALSSEMGTVQSNLDGSVDVYFGPEPPVGKENNWIQTVPGKGWFTIFRLYSPLEPWFDKTWRPGEIELAK